MAPRLQTADLRRQFAKRGGDVRTVLNHDVQAHDARIVEVAQYEIDNAIRPSKSYRRPTTDVGSAVAFVRLFLSLGLKQEFWVDVSNKLPYLSRRNGSSPTVKADHCYHD
ncbi:MAG: hypothetical protein ABIU05_06880 [Nitrospirales bacterium]